MNKIIKRVIKSKFLEYILVSVVLILGFLVRIYKVGSPVADWHSWRQADTASVTRIYVQDGINILYPRYYDISSVQTGIYNPKGYRFVEFPLYNAIHAFLAKTFPFFTLEAWGRLLSISFSLFSTYFIYLLGKRFIGGWGGFFSAFFFAFIPFNIYFSRVILPEPLAVALGLSSLWFYSKFIDESSYPSLYLSAFLFALSMLIKPFTFFYMVPLLYITFKRYSLKDLVTNKKFLLALDLALVPFFLWRVWINQFPAGIPHFAWAFNGDGIRFRPAFWRWIFGERLGRLILGIWGLIPFAIGFIKPKNYFNHFFLVGMFLYVATFATASVRHDYYQILIIPAVCLVLAQGCINLWNLRDGSTLLSRSLLVFSILMMFGMGAYQVKEYYKINHPEIVEAGDALDKIAPKDALVIAPYNGDTAFLYQTKRFGWPVVEDSIDQTIKKGASYFVTVNFNDPDTSFVAKNFKIVIKTDKYLIADLTKRIK